jgi:acyl transferase
MKCLKSAETSVGRTEISSLPTPDGEIVVFVNSPAGESRGNVVIVPPYAMSAHGYYLFQDYLTYNGFTVYRYDGIDSVGLSTGEIYDYTLGQSHRDLENVIDALFDENSSFMLFSQSLSFPVAVRQAGADPRVQAVLGVLGVTSVRETLALILGIDMGPYLARDPSMPRVQRIFGHNVDAIHFVASMLDNQYVDEADTMRDVAALNCPLYLAASRSDEYVPYSSVVPLQRIAERHGVFVSLTGTSHMIGRSVEAGKALAALTVDFARSVVSADKEPDFPPITDTIDRASIEDGLINELILDRSNAAAGVDSLNQETRNDD